MRRLYLNVLAIGALLVTVPVPSPDEYRWLTIRQDVVLNAGRVAIGALAFAGSCLAGLAVAWVAVVLAAGGHS